MSRLQHTHTWIALRDGREVMDHTDGKRRVWPTHAVRKLWRVSGLVTRQSGNLGVTMDPDGECCWAGNMHRRWYQVYH